MRLRFISTSEIVSKAPSNRGCHAKHFYEYLCIRHVIASVAKQSSVFASLGLLRYARNDEWFRIYSYFLLTVTAPFALKKYAHHSQMPNFIKNKLTSLEARKSIFIQFNETYIVVTPDSRHSNLRDFAQILCPPSFRLRAGIPIS